MKLEIFDIFTGFFGKKCYTAPVKGRFQNLMNNKTMMQYFEWYQPDDGLFWKRCAAQAEKLKEKGIDMVWLPPAYKGTSSADVGYGVYDLYDLGEFDQKGTVRTKYGTIDEYKEAVSAFQENGIEVVADIVLNHRMGADRTEPVLATPMSPTERNKPIGKPREIQAWTGFDFPGRNNQYSDFKWNSSHFDGTDLDEATGEKQIFLFEGKEWVNETDSENVNFDYLMGANVDMENPEVIEELTRWGNWYYDQIHMDGLRLDAVKHIRFKFFRDWLRRFREHAGRDIFAVGEYWSGELGKLLHYLDVTENSLRLFDVPLHYNFYNAGISDGAYDMRNLVSGCLTEQRPENSATFVDNHDTQNGQALQSFVPEWFKPLAYAVILLRNEGIPLVFYGDYYGIPANDTAPVFNLGKMVMIRKLYAYGEQRDYFDDQAIVGWTRGGDDEHEDSGIAVLMSDSGDGSKKMEIGKKFAGRQFFDVMEKCIEPVTIDEEGFGLFGTAGKNVAVWVTEEAYEKIRVEV